ncbi:MAG: hypothetical protein FJ303_13625 [Planctomycetes bacterium]|nr:hypothetical protein [Planctomycetota bacterium]
MNPRVLLCWTFITALAPWGVFAQDTPNEKVAKAQATIEKHLRDRAGSDASVAAVGDKYLRDAFPNHVFVAVHFREWPIARSAPAGLKHRNVFAVGQDGKITHFASAEVLLEFFKATPRIQVQEEKTARAWLRLRMEFIQDGFFKFKYPEKIKPGPEASSVTILIGEVEVVPEAGNSGSLVATFRFNQSGALASISEENKVVRGQRPRVLRD